MADRRNSVPGPLSGPFPISGDDLYKLFIVQEVLHGNGEISRSM